MKFLLLLSIVAPWPNDQLPQTVTKVYDSLNACEHVVKEASKKEWFIHGACIKMEFLRERGS